MFNFLLPSHSALLGGFLYLFVSVVELTRAERERQFAREQQTLARSAYFLRNNMHGEARALPITTAMIPLLSVRTNQDFGVCPPRLQIKVTDALKRANGISESIIRVENLKAAALRRRENPAGASMIFRAKPIGGRERPPEVWKRLQQNWRYIVQHSIKETSMDTYSTALRAYKLFCKTAGIADIWLQTESEGFLLAHEEELAQGWAINPFNYQVTVLLSFIAFLYGDQKVSHGTVGLYLSGVRHWFKQMFLREFDACFDESIIAQARSSLHYLAVKEDALEVEKKTLPFTCDMLVFARDVYLQRGPQSWKTRGIFVCLVVTFCCLMRSCEIFITAANHYLRGQDVVYGVMVNGVEKSIYPKDAWRYPLAAVRNVSITVHSAKNDWKGEGMGHSMFFSLNDPDTGAYGFDLVLVMFTWSQESRTRNDDAFLMFGGTEMVSYDLVSTTIHR